MLYMNTQLIFKARQEARRMLLDAQATRPSSYGKIIIRIPKFDLPTIQSELVKDHNRKLGQNAFKKEENAYVGS
jgi:hypothetical protein